MMVLDLQCGNGHFFEGWFGNSEAFSRQKETGEIRCPVCDNNQINQVLSPVTFQRSPRSAKEGEKVEPEVKEIQHFYKFIEDNFEEVGTEFAKEALKMHYGAADKRNIRGTSTTDEEKILKDEGVVFHKIPFLKREN